jgi:3-isopropylmalate/(R)-2-methylmalate dehydratase small subunit
VVHAFTSLHAVAAPFVGINVDTDQIIPARFLSKPRSGGCGQYLFHDLRFDEKGREREDFVLNRPVYREARILVGETNFGCGSSRENAVWAVQDHGFRAMIAPSFGDIFYSNSLKNGLLPVILNPVAAASLMAALKAHPGASIAIDLAAQTVTAFDGSVHIFDIDSYSKHCLLSGIDEMTYTLSQMDKIEAFERRHALTGLVSAFSGKKPG